MATKSPHAAIFSYTLAMIKGFSLSILCPFYSVFYAMKKEWESQNKKIRMPKQSREKCFSLNNAWYGQTD